MSEHFNNLSPEVHEALTILFEECAEVIQVIGKIMRHGLESDSLGKYLHPNAVELQKELSDVLISMEVLKKLGIIDPLMVGNFREAKLRILRDSPERFHHIHPDTFPTP